MPSAPYPRVLSVDAATFNVSSDLGILKTHLLGAWPNESVAQLIVGNGTTSEAPCANNWRITRRSLKARRAGEPLLSDEDPLSSAASAGGTQAGRLRREWIQPARNAVGDWLMSRPDYGREPHLLEWVRRFDPEAIFTFGASATICKAAVSLAEALNIPIVPYFTDDWASRLYGEFPWNVSLRPALLGWLRRLLALAPISLTVCDLMASEYSARYGGRFEPCVDSVDLSRYPISNRGTQSAGTVTFVYAGVLAPRRWEILALIARAVESLRKQGRSCRFHIYAPPADVATYSTMLNLSEDVRIIGTVPYSEVPMVQMNADVLVHVEAFLKGRELARTRLSLSTKIAQYLAAGRPILAVGPGAVASMEYLSRTGAASIVNSPDYGGILAAVDGLVRDSAERERMGTQGRGYCEKHHGREAASARFAMLLAEATRVGNSRG